MIFMLKLVVNLIIVVVSISSLVVGLVFLSLRDDSKDCSLAETPADLTVTSTGQYTIIQWQIPELNQECEVIYTLTYSINGGTTQQITTTNAYHSISRLDACSSISGTILATSQEGQNAESITYEEEFVPSASEIPTPDLQISEVTEESVLITWPRPADLSRCTVSYHVSLTGDRTISAFDIDEESFTIADNDYCLQAIVSVSIIVNGVTGSSLTIIYQESALSGLTYSIAGNELTARWNGHRKESDCSIQYKAEFTSSDEVQETIRTSDNVATFDYTECVDASISVTAIVLLIFSNQQATVYLEECDPALY